MQAAGLPTADYEAAVREAVAQQLLVPDGASGLAFRHALLREAIYNDLLPGERSRLHARLAELLSERPDSSAAELAVHCLASHDIPGRVRRVGAGGPGGVAAGGASGGAPAFRPGAVAVGPGA